MSLPTKRWYISLSTVASFSTSSSLRFGSIGVLAGLHVVLPVSLRRSVTYFYWEIKIPCLEWATSIPRKYFNLPNTLISNSLAKHWFRTYLSLSSFPVTIMSSTYTKRAVSLPEDECLMNNVWSPWLCLYPMVIITLANLPLKVWSLDLIEIILNIIRP